jgi:hypothetical protein
MFQEAPLDLLGAEPGLQELFQDAESLGGGMQCAKYLISSHLRATGLPHPTSTTALNLAHAARTLACMGQFEVCPHDCALTEFHSM